jgi:putative ABC transport system permease protein
MITLGGISITMMIVLLSYSLIEHIKHNDKPLSKFDRVLQVYKLSVKGYNKDGKRVFNNNGPYTKYFIDKYLAPMQTPELVASVSYTGKYKLMVGESKIDINYLYSDTKFFELCDFKFIEGRSFNEIEYKNKEKLVVVDQRTAKLINPNGSAIGKIFNLYSESYKIVGVIENVDVTKFPAASNVYVNMSSNPIFETKRNFGSNYCIALLLAKNKEDLKKISNELDLQSSKIEILDNYLKKIPKITTSLESGERHLITLSSVLKMGVDEIKKKFYYFLLGFTFLFLLLPTVNLVDINRTRMAERSEEVGVRKSFGANKKNIVIQFLIENVFVTVLGCLLSLVLSFIALYFINNSDFIPDINLSIYPISFLYSLIICVVLGIISGLSPAIKMSKLQIANNLNS